MRVDLKRALQLVVLLAAILGLSATTAFCQALFRAPIETIAEHSFTEHSFNEHSFASPNTARRGAASQRSFTQHPLLIQPSFLALERVNALAAHTAAVDFLRDSEGARQLPAFHFAAYKSSPSLEDRVAVRTNDTVFVSQSRVPLAHLWGGRLQIAGFTSTVKMENVLLGPASQSALQSIRFTQQARFSAAHSIDLYGVSVGFRFAPGVETAGRAPIWRLLQSVRE